MDFEVVVDEKQFADVERLLSGIPGAAKKVATSALNRAATHGRTLVKREIAKELNLKQAAILETLAIQPASGDNLTAAVRASRKPMPLIKYPATESAEGVTVACRKAEPPRLIHGAFIATTKSGHRGIFTREPGKVVPGAGSYAGRTIKRGPRKGQPIQRSPIRQLYGPTVVGVLANKPGLAESISKSMSDVLAKRMNAGISRYLGSKDAGDDDDGGDDA